MVDKIIEYLENVITSDGDDLEAFQMDGNSYETGWCAGRISLAETLLERRKKGNV